MGELMKLYVIETQDDGEWTPRYLHKGEYRLIVQEAETRKGSEGYNPCQVRVRRIKTPAERDQYNNKLFFEVDVKDFAARTEWVN